MRKVKKFIVLLIIACTVCFCDDTILKATEIGEKQIGNTFYVYSEISDEAMQYAESIVDQFILYHGLKSKYDNISVGNGMTIFSSDNYDKSLFPIWSDGKIIASFIVTVDDSGECAGSISGLYTLGLMSLMPMTTVENPLVLYSDSQGIYGCVGNKKYDLNNIENGYLYLEDTYCLDGNVVDACSYIEYAPFYQPRIPTDYAKSFIIYEVQNGPCYAYALGNILQNMGYSSYNASNILAYTNNASAATITTLTNYLQSKGLSCTSSTSGYMSYVGVQNAVYFQDSYILIGTVKESDTSVGHAMVLYGFADSGTEKFYTIWNPWYSYTQTISASTRRIITESSSVFVWNNGYIYGIR